MDITLIIPTKNRLYFIKKLLKYYRDLKFDGKILILDGSDDLNYETSNVFIKELALSTIFSLLKLVLPINACTIPFLSTLN